MTERIKKSVSKEVAATAMEVFQTGMFKGKSAD